MKRKMACSALCLVLALSPVIGLAETGHVVTTHPGDGISMYKEPDYVKGSVVATVPENTEVEILTIMADVPWVEASYDGKTGYIPLESVSINKPKDKDSEILPGTLAAESKGIMQTMYVTSPDGHSVRLYSEPLLDDRNAIMDVPSGKTVGVITIMADIPWAKIDYDGQVGYMMIGHLAKTKPISDDYQDETRP